MTASRSVPESPARRGRLSSWYHLVRRFFGFISARPLSPREQSEVEGLLPPDLARMFWEQSSQDQRHGLVVARRVLEDLPGDRSAAVAALLHDVGKRGIGLGAVHRSVATVMSGLRLPLRGSYRIYRNHGSIGADALAAAGAEDLTVAFARHHPGPPPPEVDPVRWRVLLDADHA